VASGLDRRLTDFGLEPWAYQLLTKAFDTLDHHILLTKLDDHGFSVQTVKWFKSYLSDRSQSLQLVNTLSEPYQITCGVPPGSILARLSPSYIYINDLINKTEVFTPILFADDTNLFFISRSLNDDLPTLNKQLDKIADWCFSNNLTLNIEKTNYIIIQNYQNTFTYSTYPVLNVPSIQRTQ